ncbi:hypothetical protein MXM82_10745 [Pseudomonas asiatica]|uniref:hypothetical protein n=1 Tax=Pseudomonas asiatica TaxID=2219225 RepID=UPI002DBDBE2A|nr:hypothetical protein [Pseudomonas asiatica]MEB6589608.1 hypothetical protein [Pseudomonas asiatica]
MRILIGAVGLGLLAGCGSSVEDKMVSVCTDIVKMSVIDPGAMTINSSSVISANATEGNLTRFAGLRSGGELNGDQKAALDIQIKNISKINESYASIDYTDRSSGARRDKAICWFMDTGQGFELGSVSISGKGYSGISLLSLFVNHSRPDGLSQSNVIE